MSDQSDDDAIAPDEPVPEPSGRPVRPVGRLVRIGCTVLAFMSLFLLFAGGSFISDPAGVRCADARAAIEDEDEEVDADDIECDAAIARGVDIEDANIRSESAARTQGYVFLAVGLLQLGGAIATLRTLSKRARVVALVGAGISIILPVLGLLTILVSAFVVYAIFFSADARAVFGEPGGPRLFRPRQP